MGTLRNHATGLLVSNYFETFFVRMRGLRRKDQGAHVETRGKGSQSLPRRNHLGRQGGRHQQVRESEQAS